MAASGSRSGWLSRQIDAIRDDRVLRFYGAALAAANVVTFVFWYLGRTDLRQTLSNAQSGYCWPFGVVPRPRLSAAAIGYLLFAFLFLSLLSARAFC